MNETAMYSKFLSNKFVRLLSIEFFNRDSLKFNLKVDKVITLNCLLCPLVHR